MRKENKWTVAASHDDVVGCREAHEVARELGVSPVTAMLLVNRGYATPESARAFLTKAEEMIHDPFLMRDMSAAVQRINESVSDGEKIAVFGDYDVDGITATVILVDYLRSRGADVTHYIPRRIEDGYGLSEDAIRGLYEKGVRLLITVDCGITGVDEVAFANSLGMDVVVTDHHECKEELPDAVAVVDPHRSDCDYPFKHLAGCGVALKLALALGGVDRENALFARYCTLAAIGTVADVMQMADENRTIVSRGLASIDHSDFIGLHALLHESGLDDKDITSVQIGFVLAPRINAAGRMGAADKAADLLLCDDPVMAEKLAKELCALNRERQSVEQDIYSEALQLIEEMPESERNALVLSSAEWHQGVVGIVASRLSEKFSCPSFMIHLNGDVGKGSCRSWGGFNLFAALEACSDLLLGFGGHELAAGFTIQEENIPAFRERMNRYVRSHCGAGVPVSSLDIDVSIDRPSQVSLAEVEALSSLEPYGAGNNRPVFCLQGATLERAQNVGQNRHLKLRLSKGNVQFEGIFFSATAESCGCAVGTRVDAAFYLQVNEFRNNRTVQMQMVDIRPSLSASFRESGMLALLDKCLGNQYITVKEAARLLPTREQFIHAWRALERHMADGPLCTAYLPFIRQISTELGGTESFMRAALCLEIFSERGLLKLKHEGDDIFLALSGQGKKVNLADSVYIQTLQSILDTKGGGPQ